jgi:hypothetical protein
LTKKAEENWDKQKLRNW